MGATASVQKLQHLDKWHTIEPQTRAHVEGIIKQQQEHIQHLEGLLKERVLAGLVKARDQQRRQLSGPLKAQDKRISSLQKKLDSRNSQLKEIEEALSNSTAKAAVAAVENIFHEKNGTDPDGRGRSIRSCEDRKQISEVIQLAQVSVLRCLSAHFDS